MHLSKSTGVVVMAWYFRHDYSARNDRKITELEMEMGENIGYAMWFKMLEVMGEMGGSLSKDKLKVAAYSMRVPLDLLMQFIRICVRIELLDENGDEYVNPRFAEECARIKETSQKASNSAKIKWEKERMLKPKTKSINPMKRLPAQEIIECWNAHAKSLRCMKLTNAIEKAIVKLCKEYTLDEIQQSIENYHSVLNDPACFFSYKWNLGEFLSRQNGFPVFAGDRDEIIGKYRKSSKPKLPQKIKSSPSNPKPKLRPEKLPIPIPPPSPQPKIAKPQKINKSDSENKKLMADVNEIVEVWNNTAKICKCRKVTNEIIKATKKRLETYSLEEIKTIILNYQTILQDDNTYFTYAWNLYEFLTRAKSFEYFNDDITVLSAKYRKFDADDSDGQKDGDKWNWSFPQPKEWDSWSLDERKTYIKNNCIKETK